MHRIVVGFDGSKGSEGALRFALDEARLRGAELRVVCAWMSSDTAYAGIGYVPVDLKADEENATAATIQRARALLGDDPGVAVEITPVQGSPVESLLMHAPDADMLVVGSRGLSGVKKLLLGSVSQQVAQRSPCPVTIVPIQAD